MTRLGQLKEMLSAADSRRYDAGSGAGAGPGGVWGGAPAGVQRSWRRGVGGGASPRASVARVMEWRQS